jgi:hypothetical protein
MLRSRQVLDADRCVTAMFAQMADHPRRDPGRRPAVAVAVPVDDTPHVIL